jgi:hypothetical protein
MFVIPEMVTVMDVSAMSLVITSRAPLTMAACSSSCSDTPTVPVGTGVGTRVGASERDGRSVGLCVGAGVTGVGTGVGKWVLVATTSSIAMSLVAPAPVVPTNRA